MRFSSCVALLEILAGEALFAPGEAAPFLGAAQAAAVPYLACNNPIIQNEKPRPKGAALPIERKPEDLT
ncbi:MAG: hypothetical protein U1A24_21005 [Cypionkella sp.]|nr:hypothetical protein [Cypionkella sp.]